MHKICRRVLAGILLVIIGAVGVYAADDSTAPSQQACSGYSTQLTGSGQGRVTPGAPNNVRSLPNADAQQIGQIPGGGVFTILEGPRCGSGYTWYRVNHNGLIGWTAEGQGNTHWLEMVTGGGGGANEPPDETSVNPNNTNPPDILDGMAFGAGGGGEAPGVCETNLADRPATGLQSGIEYLDTGLNPREMQFSSGSTVVFNNLPSSIRNMPSGAVDLPAICVFLPVSSQQTYAISPDGTRTRAVLGRFTHVMLGANDRVYTAQLPLEAYTVPGTWRLGVEVGLGYEISIVIPSSPNPFYISDENRVVVGGFQPFERIVGLRGEGFLADEVTWERFEFQANANGYALVTFPRGKAGCFDNCMFVGQQRTIVRVEKAVNTRITEQRDRYVLDYAPSQPTNIGRVRSRSQATREILDQALYEAIWG